MNQRLLINPIFYVLDPISFNSQTATESIVIQGKEKQSTKEN